MSDTDYEEPKDYRHEGATDGTNYLEFEDRDGDAYYDEKEKMPVWGLVVIIFACGMVVTGVLFYMMIRHDQQKRAATKAKLEIVRGSTRSFQTGVTGGPSSRYVVTSTQNINNHSNTTSSSSGQMKSGQDRVMEIERGVMIQTWMAEVHPDPDEEAKTDEDEESNINGDQSTFNSRNACPICRRHFETGDDVVSSRNDNCRHNFHKTCIFNWLQYQTRCPVCNEEYLQAPSASCTVASSGASSAEALI